MEEKIKINMYEVQLGASILLQFQEECGKAVRILADAGITVKKDKGYTQDHVFNKLRQTLGPGTICINLIVGTHYDEDHLFGLIPIIEDEEIKIGEAWLPPVANDTELRTVDAKVLDNHLLAHQFAGEKGQENLLQYLKSKQAACEELLSLEQSADQYREGSLSRQNLFSKNDSFTRDITTSEAAVSYFRTHQSDASATLEDRTSDSDIPDFSIPILDNASATTPLGWHYFFNSFHAWDQGDRQQYFNERWNANRSRTESDVVRLAHLRKSIATDAITAIHLAKVVAALKKRNIPITCHIIEDGKPQRFVWDSTEGRFIPGNKLSTDGPEVLLLGPSQGLVKKLREKLPVGDYLLRLAYDHITARPISPSNQLSYVLRFKAEKQGILVCGDAGCVDFKSSTGEFHKDLLSQLLPLHVIQIAHHAGYNGDFYNVLLEAGYPDQTDKSFLLLSHATEDPTRPSKEFCTFIGQARQAGDDMQILFTSRPSTDKVRDFVKIIHKSVGKTNDVGDVLLVYDGKEWKVNSHAISLGNV